MGFNDRMDEITVYSLSFNEKSICFNCIADDYLAEIIKSNATQKKCSYCWSVGNKNIACEYKFVAQKIYDRIFLSYKDAQDTAMPYAEGEWVIEQVYIQDVINDFNPGWNDQFIEDLCESADPSLYLVSHVQDDWIGVPKSAVLSFGWQSFKEQILYKTRYLFLTQKSSGYDDFYSIPLTSMLNQLGDLSNRLGLIREIPKDSNFYRVRAHKKGQEFTEFEEIGVAPKRLAGAGRMNPAGIPYFYIAFMSDTAKLEVIDDQQYWSLAKLKLLNNIQVLDLTKLPQAPSIFDISQHDLREEIKFLYEFVNDLLKPVAKDGKEHIDYVPTQVVSEYFRYVFEPKLQGIMYPSVKHLGGVNIAVFESDNDEIQKKFNLEEIIECENTES
ncbi:RES domain-containing protein [Acinetobacter sp. YH12096]|uniref:RES domain-containing protein n=1 Tax=Acinetobacter sp. YH12096 TaxID=2601085 RepID=UPI0015D1F2B0|nr:HEPN-associated N-terminal domain-containing protein [Acinetobacter sp. YH12096]